MRIKLLVGITKLFVCIAFLSAMAISCRDDFKFDEFDKYDDSISINGNIAVPLVNNEISFEKLKESAIGPTATMDYDNNNLVHIYFDQTVSKALSSVNTSTVGNQVSFDVEMPSQRLFSSESDGEVWVKNPVMTFSFVNNFADNLTVSIKSLTFKVNSSVELPVSSSHLSTISSSGKKGETLTIVLENDESGDISSILSQLPVSYVLTLSFVVDNLNSTSDLEIKSHIDLPMEVKMDNFSFSDTTKVEFDEEIFDNVDSLAMLLKATNDMPLEFNYTAYFYSKSALPKTKAVFSTPIQPSGNTYDTTCYYRSDIDWLTDHCDCFVYKFSFSTPGGTSSDYIKILHDQTLKIKMSMRAGASYALEEQE